jgi:hypothetical protein
MLSGMIQNLQGLQGLQANQVKMDELNTQKMNRSKATELLRSYQETQDPAKLNEAILLDADLSQNVLSGIGIQDKARGQRAASDYIEMVGALGNKDQFNQIMARRVDDILKSGGDPSDSLALVKTFNEQGPEAALQMAQPVGAALVNQGYLRPELYAGKQQEPMTAFQQASTSLRQQELEFNKQQKKLDFEMKALEAKLKRESNELEKQKIQADIDNKKADLAAKQEEQKSIQKKKESGNLMLADAYSTVKAILSDEQFPDVVGTFDASVLSPTAVPKSQDLINKATRLQSLLTVDNLGMMSGVLTDKDIQFLTNIGSGLNITENGIKGSEEGVKARLNEIMKTIERAAKAKGVDLDALTNTVDSAQPPAAFKIIEVR